jgi:hypothetical protein
MRRHDVAYYRERAKTERKLAAASENEDVAAIHEELARQYEALVEQADLRPALRMVVPAEGTCRPVMGVWHERSVATKLGPGSAAGGARPSEHSDQSGGT